MKAALRRFLWLWLPGLVVLVIGLVESWQTGQVDPWNWGWAALLCLAPSGWGLAKRDSPLHWAIAFWVGMGAAGTALIFCAIAAARLPDPVVAGGLLIVSIAVTAGSVALCCGRWLLGVSALVLSLLLVWLGPVQPFAPIANRPPLAVLTGLPLFWSEPGQGASAIRMDAPIVTVLRTRFTVMPIDDPAAFAASGAQRLLLAQPRAMSPAAMVAIDRWVRNGGTALVLADPLLRWPSRLPAGDRRRAPSASQLGPLLTHWGFTADQVNEGEIRYFTPDADLLTLSGVQLFSMDTGTRSVGSLHRKRIGRGEVLLLGDADLIDDRLWLADPDRPLDPRAWVADTPAWIAARLGAPMPDDRRWMRQPHDVTKSIALVLWAGLIWAILGSGLFAWQKTSRSSRTKDENLLSYPSQSE